VPVAVAGVRAGQLEFAHLAWQEFRPVVVDNACVDVQAGHSDAVGLLPREAVWHREVVGATLGEAVPLGHREAALAPGLDDRLPAGAAAALDQAQRGEVRPGPLVVFDHEPQDSGDRDKHRCRVLLDKREHLPGVEVPGDDDGPAEVEQRDRQDVPAAGVKERKHHRRRVVGTQSPGEDRVERVPGDTSVCLDHLLGEASRSAGVEKEVWIGQRQVGALDGAVVGWDGLCVRLPALIRVERVAEDTLPGHVVGHPEHGEGVAECLRTAVGERRFGDQQRGVDIVEHLAEFAGREPM